MNPRSTDHECRALTIRPRVPVSLSRLYIEEKGKIDEVIPLSFLMHTTTPGTHAQLMFPAQSLYVHKAVTRKAVKTKKSENHIPDGSGQLAPTPDGKDKKIAKTPLNKGVKSIPQTKSKQVVTTSIKEIRRATHEQLINEQKVATNDTSINTDLVQTIKVPSLDIIQAPKPLINTFQSKKRLIKFSKICALKYCVILTLILMRRI